MTLCPLVYRIAGMETVSVRRDVVYREGARGPRGFDVYTPRDVGAGSRLPAVIFVIGYSDLGAVPRFGCTFKEMESFVNWAQLVAASGMIGITYTNVEPAADVRAVIAYVREHAAQLGIDAERIGVWACSGNTPVALSTLLADAPVKIACAAFCYGMMLDVAGTTYVADAARMYGFENPCAGKTVDDLARDTPIFIARAGQDEFAHLNDAIDAFVAAALARNMPLTLVNHATGPHSFDVVDDSDTSREIIRRIVDFFRFHLVAHD
jgi:hypothetical protein